MYHTYGCTMFCVFIRALPIPLATGTCNSLRFLHHYTRFPFSHMYKSIHEIRERKAEFAFLEVSHTSCDIVSWPLTFFEQRMKWWGQSRYADIRIQFLSNPQLQFHICVLCILFFCPPASILGTQQYLLTVWSYKNQCILWAIIYDPSHDVPVSSDSGRRKLHAIGRFPSSDTKQLRLLNIQLMYENDVSYPRQSNRLYHTEAWLFLLELRYSSIAREFPYENSGLPFVCLASILKLNKRRKLKLVVRQSQL